MKLSARNQLAGKVKAVKMGSVMAEVVIDIGGKKELVAAITKGSAEGLGLTLGDQVLAVIKSTEIIVAKE
jgi:molybdopterin-binding protein